MTTYLRFDHGKRRIQEKAAHAMLPEHELGGLYTPVAFKTPWSTRPWARHVSAPGWTTCEAPGGHWPLYLRTHEFERLWWWWRSRFNFQIWSWQSGCTCREWLLSALNIKSGSDIYRAKSFWDWARIQPIEPKVFVGLVGPISQSPISIFR